MEEFPVLTVEQVEQITEAELALILGEPERPVYVPLPRYTDVLDG